MKLGILTTHPVQYQAPWFRLLSRVPGIDLTVFYGLIPDRNQQGTGFGVPFQWDVPLLSGYQYEVLPNIAASPSVDHFAGCDTPMIDQIVRDGKFDAFIVNGWVAKSCLQLLWACQKYGTPCIVRGESNNIRRRPRWKRLAHRLLLSRYAAFLYIGEANRCFYLENGAPEKKLFFAPYGIDNESFGHSAQVLRPQRDEIRAGWNIPREAVTFVFSGKFIAKKRPLDLLCGLAELQRTKPELCVHLLMVGSGELVDACRDYAREHGLPVTFAGFLNQSEMPRAYIASDCQLLPSDAGETWGLVVNEGMACGLSAIVSDQVGCHLDLITSSKTGAVYPMGDIKSLATCMGEMAADRVKLRRMGSAAAERVARYSYEEVVRGALSALNHLGPRR